MTLNLPLFDVHCHVIESPEQLDILSTIRTQYMALMSAKVEDWPKVRQLHRSYPDRTVPCFGVHPWYATKARQYHPTWLEDLRTELTENPQSIIGEIGLDKVAKNEEGKLHDWEDQESVFLDQWKLAVELQRPISMHAVQVSGYILDFFRKQAKLGEVNWPPKIMLHSFNGSVDLRLQLLKLKRLNRRLYFSFSMTIQQRQEKKLEEWLSITPLNQILLESDVHQTNQVDDAMEQIYMKVEKILGKAAADGCFKNSKEFFFQETI
ncbi:hypothetical protein HMI54_014950 [Coelomomyces lativittatus]|nr:hypothetical protein HMI55_003199 [Coelomomyces lativittatus]KAJ1507933.1 hypothetical protein HMI56_007538 [Coelomomyces lativittatus]KAJ1518572.1 hypothetical protein HMI54_014950 [Coelomomyces lativittatus]